MSRARWQIQEEDDKFTLEVMVESGVRENRVLIWRGRIGIGSSGWPSLSRMHLAGIEGEGADESKRPGKQRDRVLRDLLMDNCTNSGGVREIMEKVAAACERDSQKFEDLMAAQAERDKRERMKSEATTRELRELASAGVQGEAGR